MNELLYGLVAVYAVSCVAGWLVAAIVALLLMAASLYWQGQGMRVRQKIQIATWSAPSEGSIFAKASFDAAPMLEYIERKNKDPATPRISITHAVGKAIADSLVEAPCLNGRLLLGRFVPYPSLDVSFLVAVEGGNNLAHVKVSNAPTKSVFDFANELNAGAQKVRTGKDENFKKSMGPLKMLPVWLVKLITYWGGWAAGALGVSIPALGVQAFPFGTCCITSVGMFGIQEAFAPFTPFTRVPILALIGAVHDGAVVKDGSVCVAKKLKIMCTIDHRFIDGAQSKKMMAALRDIFENPELLERTDFKRQR